MQSFETYQPPETLVKLVSKFSDSQQPGGEASSLEEHSKALVALSKPGLDRAVAKITHLETLINCIVYGGLSLTHDNYPTWKSALTRHAKIFSEIRIGQWLGSTISFPFGDEKLQVIADVFLDLYRDEIATRFHRNKHNASAIIYVSAVLVEVFHKRLLSWERASANEDFIKKFYQSNQDLYWNHALETLIYQEFLGDNEKYLQQRIQECPWRLFSFCNAKHLEEALRKLRPSTKILEELLKKPLANMSYWSGHSVIAWIAKEENFKEVLSCLWQVSRGAKKTLQILDLFCTNSGDYFKSLVDREAQSLLSRNLQREINELITKGDKSGLLEAHKVLVKAAGSVGATPEVAELIYKISDEVFESVLSLQGKRPEKILLLPRLNDNYEITKRLSNRGFAASKTFEHYLGQFDRLGKAVRLCADRHDKGAVGKNHLWPHVLKLVDFARYAKEFDEQLDIRYVKELHLIALWFWQNQSQNEALKKSGQDEVEFCKDKITQYCMMKKRYSTLVLILGQSLVLWPVDTQYQLAQEMLSKLAEEKNKVESDRVRWFLANLFYTMVIDVEENRSHLLGAKIKAAVYAYEFLCDNLDKDARSLKTRVQQQLEGLDPSPSSEVSAPQQVFQMPDLTLKFFSDYYLDKVKESELKQGEQSTSEIIDLIQANI